MPESKPPYRPLTKQESDACFAMLNTIDDMRTVFVGLEKLGWQAPIGFDQFDNGREIIRALATDTHSLVRITTHGSGKYD